ncbi:hypothetical protein PIB30_050503 [Stylosanthes scabra]|uniref:Uncharacterized protein n=1 Tax=Stylosanthes scabra TaxID=79078 RepID=A0ABU6RI85_9FABA|nr:hypothetical protein [Stylosanthes scabra]
MSYGIFLSKFFIAFGVDLSKESYFEVKSFLKEGGGIKKTTDRSTKEQSNSTAPRSSKGPKLSNSKKIKKLVKIVKELIGEVTRLVNMLITFSKNRHSQEGSDQRNLTKTKKLLEMIGQDLQELEEEVYHSKEEDEKEVVYNEEEEPEESDV